MAMLNNQWVARLYCSSGNLPRCHGLALGHMHRGLGRLAHSGAIFDAQLTGRASGSQVRYGKERENLGENLFSREIGGERDVNM